MKPDEKLTKETGRPVIKGVMDHDDLDVGQEVDEKVPEAELDPAVNADRERLLRASAGVKPIDKNPSGG